MRSPSWLLTLLHRREVVYLSAGLRGRTKWGMSDTGMEMWRTDPDHTQVLRSMWPQLFGEGGFVGEGECPNRAALGDGRRRPTL